MMGFFQTSAHVTLGRRPRWSSPPWANPPCRTTALRFWSAIFWLGRAGGPLLHCRLDTGLAEVVQAVPTTAPPPPPSPSPPPAAPMPPRSAGIAASSRSFAPVLPAGLNLVPPPGKVDRRPLADMRCRRRRAARTGALQLVRGLAVRENEHRGVDRIEFVGDDVVAANSLMRPRWPALYVALLERPCADINQ